MIQPAPPQPSIGAPRWGYQGSIIQPRQPAFWLFTILLVITGLLTVGEQLKILQAFPTAWLFSWLLLALWLVPVIVAIYLLDQFEREPVSILVAAFTWGAVGAIGLAIITNTAWFQILFKLFGLEFVQTWGPAIIGPAVEETLKYLGLVLIWLIARTEIDDLFDGFVYGAMVGLGFATVENVGYFISPVVATGGTDQLGPVFQMYLLRVLFSGFYMHVLWTGLTGVGLAYYVTRRDQPHSRRVLVAAALFAAGVLSHFVWNSPLLISLLQGRPGPIEMLLFGIFKGLPFLLFLGVLILLAQRRERRWFEIATASEVGTDVLSSDEVASLGDLRRRVAARRAMARTHGGQAGKLLGRLQREQINLAMVRTRVGDDQHPDLVRQRGVIRALKAQLAAVPLTPVPTLRAPLPTLGAAQQPAQSAEAAPTVTPAPDTAQAVTAELPDWAATQPAVPPSAVVQDVWSPTHRVPETGMVVWSSPDPRLPPMLTLQARLDVRVAEQAGDWARVVASNGWTGWVDARLLVRLAT
ncbi:MAG: PrsW family intramembrane metalloprotease [Chloroflexi bacterium]|nr:PrsW family intramembrane metalloprotease [Chloroflexota bacterium]